MKNAEAVVVALLDGKVGDWLSDKWNDIKVATGIGHDSFGLGKADKSFKPKYRSTGAPPRKVRRPLPQQSGEKVWEIK